MDPETMSEFTLKSLHYYDPESKHRNDVPLCHSCQVCLLGIDADFPEPNPQQICASCGKVQPNDYLHSLAETIQSISTTIAACETDFAAAYSRSQIHAALIGSLLERQGDDGVRWMKYQRQTYSLLPAPETACQNGDVSWSMATNGRRIGECWAPIDAPWRKLRRAAHRALRALENPIHAIS